jgi:hypothetical protein
MDLRWQPLHGGRFVDGGPVPSALARVGTETTAPALPNMAKNARRLMIGGLRHGTRLSRLGEVGASEREVLAAQVGRVRARRVRRVAPRARDGIGTPAASSSGGRVLQKAAHALSFASQ